MIGSSQEAFDVDAGTPTLTLDLLLKVDAYWRAANFLSVGQVYSCDNPLLKRRLTLAA